MVSVNVEIKRRIRSLIEKHHGTKRGAFAAFAREIQVSTSNVAEWLDEDKPVLPGAKAIAKIFERYPEDAAWLITGDATAKYVPPEQAKEPVGERAMTAMLNAATEMNKIATGLHGVLLEVCEENKALRRRLDELLSKEKKN